MFSLLTRASRSLGFVKQNFSARTISLCPALWSNLTSRDIMDPSHGESGTLAQRFIKYMALESCKYDPLVPQKIKYSQYYPVNDVHDFRSLLANTELDQLPRLLIYTYTYKTNGEPIKIAVIINEIDNICCRKLNEMNNGDILRILYSFMYLIPNKLANLDFYRNAMQKLVKEFDSKTMRKEEFIQLCYYLGLGKKNFRNGQYVRELLDKHLITYQKDLNKMDFAIVSNAAFRTSVVLDNNDFRQRLIDETLSTDANDDAILITLVKCLRLNRIGNEEINLKLKSILLDSKNVKKLHFKGLVHIFAYFADNLWNEPEVCQKLVAQCKKQIENTRIQEYEPFNDVRAKDISTFLWSYCNLNLSSLTEKDINFIKQIVLQKFQNNDYRYSPDNFIDTCLTLWMLNCKSKDLIDCALSIKHALQLQHQKSQDRIKLDSRLKLLLNCVHLEKPEWLNNKKPSKTTVFDEARLAPEYLMKNRTCLEKITKILHDQQNILNLKSHHIVLPISELNVPSLLLEQNDGRKIFVEVLEKDQTLKFCNSPIQLVQFKIKLLENLGHHVITVDHNDIQSNDNIIALLKEKIDSIACLEKDEVAVQF